MKVTKILKYQKALFCN